MYKILAAVAALALIAVPALADEADDESITGVGDLYVADSGLYEESNELDGLQRDVTVKDDEEILPDTKLL